MNHLCHGSLLQSQSSALTGRTLIESKSPSSARACFICDTHTPSGKADKMGNMSYRISVFKINGHDLLACSSVAMKSNNIKGPNENKYSANVATCLEFHFPFLMDF